MIKCISKFKILLLSIGFMFTGTSMMAQSSLTLDASQVISTFKFTDSEGSKDKSYSASYSGAYSVGYRNATDFGLIIRASIGMHKAGATLMYDSANYMWTLQYADAKLGVGYIYNGDRFSPYLTVSSYLGFLLKANQTLNNQDFDIKKSKSLTNIDQGILISSGVQITLSDDISAYTEFSYRMGLKNIETNDNGQKATNIAYALTLGLAFTIK